MKRTILIVTGLATLAVGVYLGSRVGAQTAPPAQGAPAAAPLRSRIALINMLQVLKNYKKFMNAETDLKARIKQVEGQLEAKQSELVKHRTALQGTQDAAQREQIEKEMRRIQREAQELQEDSRKELAKQQGDLAVQIYKEVEDAVRAFAKAYDIELVLQFNDAQAPADYYSPGNVHRKITTIGPVMPMYFDPRMDITNSVTEWMNKRLTMGGATRAGSGN